MWLCNGHHMEDSARKEKEIMFKVYYTDPVDNKCYAWDCSGLIDALAMAKRFRDLGMTFVTMVAQDPNCVGKMGVDSIEDGMCPDGVEYSWRKRR